MNNDDPRLTAYALGELEDEARAQVEASIAHDAALAQAVGEIRATAAQLTAALVAEPLPESAPLAIEFEAPAPARVLARPSRRKHPFFSHDHFPYLLVSTLAAACFAIVFFIYDRSQTPLHSEIAAAARQGNGSAGTNHNLRLEVVVMQKLSDGAQPSPPVVESEIPAGTPPFNTEAYDHIAENNFQAVAQHPLSTFAIDVDTASYSNVRRFLLAGERPPRDAVRIEELLNYFQYNYAAPAPADEAPFAASLEVAAAPWAEQHRLVRIGLKGRELAPGQRPAANLVFLVDVSGSMQPANKLPLVKESLRLLLERLEPRDRVALAVYAGASGLVLPSTPVTQKREILAAIDHLDAGGSTNGAMGIQLAYDLAKANFITGGVNRVILATDGDFNIGVTNRGDLVRLIEDKAKSGVFLTVLGYGMGNIQDATLEELADRGNGAYAYIDSAREARRVLFEQAAGTLATIAKDVKLQVEFNPTRVQAYRLIGYENRALADEDFNNDAVDAGDIGAGHTVTALYEVIPAGVPWTPDSSIDALKYQTPPATSAAAPSHDLLTVKIRYKRPDADASKLLEFALVDHGAAFADASDDFKFAAAVAGFGMVLRDSPHRGSATFADVSRWSAGALGNDPGGYRAEFLSLVTRARQLAQ